jgi:hypothetical protein
MQKDVLSVTLLTDNFKRELSEALCQLQTDKPLREIDLVIIKDIHNNFILLQTEKNLNKPASISVNLLAGEARQFSFASSFSYVVTHEPNRPVGERCGITEYKNGVPSTFYLENRGFTYNGENEVYRGKHFYMEHQNGRCCLYFAIKEQVHGQRDRYVKTGSPLLCSV